MRLACADFLTAVCQGPAARLHQHTVEASGVEAAHHGMAGVRAATVEGGVPAGRDALEVEAAAVVLGGTPVGDGEDSRGRDGHGGGRRKAEGGTGVRGLHLALSRHGEGILARGLRVEASAGLRIPLHAPCGGLRVAHASKAAHGLVGELLHGGRLQDPAEDGAEEDADHHGTSYPQQDQETHHAEERDSNPGAQEVLTSEGHQVHQNRWVVPDDVDAVSRLQTNKSQEQADACHGGLHHPSWEDLEDIAPEVQSGHQNEDRALHGHRQHHFLHRVLRTFEAHDGVGEVGVHAHARPEPKRQVPETGKRYQTSVRRTKTKRGAFGLQPQAQMHFQTATLSPESCEAFCQPLEVQPQPIRQGSPRAP